MCREVFPFLFCSIFLVSFVFVEILLEFPIFGVLNFLSFLAFHWSNRQCRAAAKQQVASVLRQYKWRGGVKFRIMHGAREILVAVNLRKSDSTEASILALI